MFVEGKSRTVFFPSDTLIYGIFRDGPKKFNIRTCEHMILGQLTMGARQAKNAPLAWVRVWAWTSWRQNAVIVLLFIGGPRYHRIDPSVMRIPKSINMDTREDFDRQN